MFKLDHTAQNARHEGHVIALEERICQYLGFSVRTISLHNKQGSVSWIYHR